MVSPNTARVETGGDGKPLILGDGHEPGVVVFAQVLLTTALPGVAVLFSPGRTFGSRHHLGQVEPVADSLGVSSRCYGPGAHGISHHPDNYSTGPQTDHIHLQQRTGGEYTPMHGVVCARDIGVAEYRDTEI